MKFQSEKKELWRYASKNLAAPARGTNRQQPLLHHLPHPRLPQSQDCTMLIPSSRQSSLLSYCDGYRESTTSSTNVMSMTRQEKVSTPPPPYSSVVQLDYSSNATMPNYCLTFRQNHTRQMDVETEISVSATESDTSDSRKQTHSRDGCGFVNTADIMLVDDYEKLHETSISSSYQWSIELQKKSRRISLPQKIPTSPQAVSTLTTTSPTTSLAATAAKILRNCCGGNFGSSNSITNTNNQNTNTTKLSYEHSKIGADHLTNSSKYLPEQYFSTLMKQLKASQLSSMLKAVKSRHDQLVPIMPANSTTSPTSSQRSCVANYQTNCILIRRAEILGEEPYVIACRLFLWRDLKNASQLKRLPVCPNERDPVYVCCNPLHWCRILETETAQPPYSSQRMKRIEGLNSQNGINTMPFGSTDADHIRKNYSDFQIRVSESQTTDGEGRHCSPNWCEVAYWEMSQRVGERFPAKTPTINIYSDRPYATTGDHKDGMCLKELFENRTTPSPGHVQYIRQKICLGIALSQESDGVWLYNRSTVPIFLYSPTLTESWYRVCRVEPGDCLRAFDNCRAQTLVHPDQFPGVQTGPIDKFSMRMSFGKGWGYSYKRPDITLCPCWLEVLFKPQR